MADKTCTCDCEFVANVPGVGWVGCKSKIPVHCGNKNKGCHYRRGDSW